MTKNLSAYIICFFIAAVSCLCAHAQDPDDENINPQTGLPRTTSFDSKGRPIKKDTSGQKLEHRNPLEDSITISYHYFDSTKTYKLDSSINDFFTRYPVPWTNT